MNRRTLIALAVLTTAALAGGAEAAQSPFGIATPDPGGAVFGGPFASIFHWIALRQSEFYRGLTNALSASKADGTATWLLLGLSFLYGIFHAAGPGHGKAVISAYLVSSGETARRGVVISFAAALVQAVSAILVVTIFSVIFQVTAVTMTAATDWLEIASYALIMVLGAWLVWTKAFGGGHHHHHHHHFVPAPAGHAHAHIHAEAIHDEHDHHGHYHHGHDHHGHDHHGHAHHTHGGAAGATAVATGSNPLVKAWSTILAVGIRPCSGAIIVLVFALSQGSFAVGIAATFVMAIGTGITVAVLAALAVSAKGLAVKLAGAESGFAGTVIRGIEIAGGVIVFVLGFLLLGGALSVT